MLGHIMTNNMWKTDEQEKWESIRDKSFDEGLGKFLKFLSSQDQLVIADDLVHGFAYTHVTCTDKVNICRCTIWDGILLKLDEDAQLNLSINVFGENIGEQRIYHHDKGKKLTEGWHIVESEDMMRELLK